MHNTAHICVARTTFEDGSTIMCGKPVAVSFDPADDDLPLCDYHQGIADQRLGPCEDPECCEDSWGYPVRVAARGLTLWASSPRSQLDESDAKPTAE